MNATAWSRGLEVTGGGTGVVSHAGLELIADPDARAAALAPVDQMIRARDAVAATDGDPAGLQQALADLAETFEQATGAASTRRAWANYAGRTLVYQDAVRDVRVELGEEVTRALAAPLGERPGRRRAGTAAAAAHQGSTLPIHPRPPGRGRARHGEHG